MLKGAVFLRPWRSIARHGRIGKRGTQTINCLTCFSSWTLGCLWMFTFLEKEISNFEALAATMAC
jgi:hypothetical protein